LPQLPDKMPYNEVQLLSGIAEQSRNNLTRSIEHYRNVPNNDPLSSFARFNEAIAMLDKELSRMLEEQYVRSVTISQDNSSTDRVKPKPDEKPQLSAARELLQSLKQRHFRVHFVSGNRTITRLLMPTPKPLKPNLHWQKHGTTVHLHCSISTKTV